MMKSAPEFGDTIILSLGKTDVMSIKLKENGVSQTRFGAVKHSDVIGKTYGSKINTSRGFIHILQMDPTLWSETLPHRTQIIYPTDASLIVGGLDLVPGKRVFEAGTGSGSLTHFLAHAIAPNGCVQTFDFHKERVETATAEFKDHALDHIVKVNHRDVCLNYFPVVGDPENQDGVDAVILDLPQPWKVVPHLPKVYRPVSGGRVCLFSPCIEQVQRSCDMLRQTGFVQIKTIECIQREYDIVRAVLNVPNMGQHEVASLLQQSNASETDDAESQPAPTTNTVTRALLPPPPTARWGKRNRKRQREDQKCKDAESAFDTSADRPADQEQNGSADDDREAPFTWEPILPSKMTGHTGYLTFASWLAQKPSKSIRDDQDDDDVSDVAVATDHQNE